MMMVMPSNHGSIATCSKSLWGTVSLIPVGKKYNTKLQHIVPQVPKSNSARNTELSKFRNRLGRCRATVT
jgi:hypothetical protein